ADVRAPAAGDERRAFLLRRLDVAQVGLELLLRRNRAKSRLRIHRISGRHLLRARSDLVDEFVLDRFVDEQPRSGRADLALAVNDASSSGKFHGTIAATTPTGSRSV